MYVPLMMPPEPTSALSKPDPAELFAAFEAYLEESGRHNRCYRTAGQSFLSRWPDPALWAAEPLQVRLCTPTHALAMLRFLMLWGHLQPGYDYLFEHRPTSLCRELIGSPLEPDAKRFVAGAIELGYSVRIANGPPLHMALRLLIQTAQPLEALVTADLETLEAAITEREAFLHQTLKHYRDALFATRVVLYHLGAEAEPRARQHPPHHLDWSSYFENVNPAIAATLVAYLEIAQATRAKTTINHIATNLGHFGRHLREIDPVLADLGELDRRRHIEPYLSIVADECHWLTGAPLAPATKRMRVTTVSILLEDIAEWGWPEAPGRKLIFARDLPRLPRPLPRYLPPSSDLLLGEGLACSPNKFLADALLLLRATGMRVGEALDLELDCVHEIPGQGAWLKVPLGKLDTERMVPLDDEALAIVDRLVEARSPGRPLRHPRSGKLVDFLLVRRGQRVTRHALSRELERVAREVDIGHVHPHQLRHTYATALVNAGCSLQALMALLGHVSAEMSLRYGRLFDSTVRENYELALRQAKECLGPVLGQATPVTLEADWRCAPLIKSRLASGYCVRTQEQGACPYTHICEFCPAFRTDSEFLAVLGAQRADAEILAADAQARGWDGEILRHRRIIERLDLLMDRVERND
jgi:integrase